MTRILLVEDDADVRDLAAMLLEAAGFAVTAVESAPAALSALRGQPGFAAVVTDHAMPGMTGEELIEVLATEYPALPCLLISGFSTGGWTGTSARVLRKPYRAHELTAAVRGLLDPA